VICVDLVLPAPKVQRFNGERRNSISEFEAMESGAEFLNKKGEGEEKKSFFSADIWLCH